MLDGNACAARCWEGRARQRLEYRGRKCIRSAFTSASFFLTVFQNNPRLAKATQGARLVYIIDTFVAARHRRENKCLRGAPWRVFIAIHAIRARRYFANFSQAQVLRLRTCSKSDARVNETGWPCASRRRTGQAAGRLQRRRPVELLFAPADGVE